ncbi:hypothetical protein HDU67_000146 [Dinochytrium kinnereticum]|nr:hypothetical protein HDU67_000146 [Dinochytrium kinnereticum]
MLRHRSRLNKRAAKAKAPSSKPAATTSASRRVSYEGLARTASNRVGRRRAMNTRVQSSFAKRTHPEPEEEDDDQDEEEKEDGISMVHGHPVSGGRGSKCVHVVHGVDNDLMKTIKSGLAKMAAGLNEITNAFKALESADMVSSSSDEFNSRKRKREKAHKKPGLGRVIREHKLRPWIESDDEENEEGSVRGMLLAKLRKRREMNRQMLMHSRDRGEAEGSSSEGIIIEIGDDDEDKDYDRVEIKTEPDVEVEPLVKMEEMDGHDSTYRRRSMRIIAANSQNKRYFEEEDDSEDKEEKEYMERRRRRKEGKALTGRDFLLLSASDDDDDDDDEEEDELEEEEHDELDEHNDSDLAEGGFTTNARPRKVALENKFEMDWEVGATAGRARNRVRVSSFADSGIYVLTAGLI